MSHVPPNMEAVLTGRATLAGSPAALPTGIEEQLRAQHFELLRRCQRRVPGAFEELVHGFQPRVASVIRGILRNSNDAEDIAQQVFTKVYFALDKFNFQSSVATWVYKIAVNECYDHLRKQKVRKVAILADLSLEESARIENSALAASASLESRIAERELAAKLLARLDLDDRVLLVLKEIEGYSVHEVAEILGLNENTVKVRLFRARQALLDALKKNRV